jgi:hypothetical protein
MVVLAGCIAAPLQRVNISTGPKPAVEPISESVRLNAICGGNASVSYRPHFVTSGGNFSPSPSIRKGNLSPLRSAGPSRCVANQGKSRETRHSNCYIFQARTTGYDVASLQYAKRGWDIAIAITHNSTAQTPQEREEGLHTVCQTLRLHGHQIHAFQTYRKGYSRAGDRSLKMRVGMTHCRAMLHKIFSVLT